MPDRLDDVDPEDFPQGNPCGKLTLRELRCDTWGGFVWYTMDDEAPSLMDFLAPIPEIYRNYPMETAVSGCIPCFIRSIPSMTSPTRHCRSIPLTSRV